MAYFERGLPLVGRLSQCVLCALFPLTIAMAGEVRWNGGGDGTSWTDPLNWSGDILPGASDRAVLTNGTGTTVTFNATATIGSLSVGGVGATQTLSILNGTLTVVSNSVVATNGVLQLSGGILQRTNDVSIAGRMEWTGGGLSGPGSVTILPGAELLIGGTTHRYLYSGTLRNEGLVSWTQSGGYLYFQAGLIHNETNGVFEAGSDGTLYDGNGTGTAAVFENDGTFKKTAGTGNTRFLYVPVHNDGLLQVDSGTVRAEYGGTASGVLSVTNGAAMVFYGGTFVLEPGVVCMGDGLYRVETATVECAGDVDANHWELGGGELTGAGRFLVTGTCVWTGGMMTGGGETRVSPSGTLEISGSGNRTLDGRTLRNEGLVSWTQSGGYLYFQKGLIHNDTNGVFEAGSDGTLYDGNGTGTAAVFQNDGTFKKTAGTGNTRFLYVPVHNDGLLEVDSGTVRAEYGGTASGAFSVTNGAAMVFYGGTFVLEPGVVCTGDGLYRIETATVECAGDVDAKHWELVSGELTGAGRLLVTGTCVWTGGMMTGGGETRVSSSGTLEISGSGNRTLDGRTLRNEGLVSWTQTGGTFYFQQGLIHNDTNGVFEAGSDSLLYDGNGTGTAAVFQNDGTFKKTAGTGNTRFLYVPVHNDGLLEVDSGTVRAEYGGTASGAFSVTNGASMVFYSGTFVLEPGVVCTGDGLYRIETATVECAGDVDAKHWELVSGELTGAGGFLVTGTCVWTGGMMTGGGETRVSSSGTLEISGSGNRTLDGRTLRNEGLVSWTQTGGTFYFQEGLILNDTNGVFEAGSDGTLYDSSGILSPATLVNDGTFRKSAGSGTTALINLFFQNNGELDLQSGVVNLNTDFTPDPGGVLKVRVAGTTVGTGYSRLNIDATAHLDGTLIVDRDPAFTPAVGTSLDVVTFDSLATPFQVVSNRTIVPPLEFDPVYSSTALSLLVVDTTTPSNVPPDIVVSPSSRAVYRGEDVSLRPVVNGPPPLHFQWQYNSTNLPGESGATLLLSNVQTNQSGAYRVIVTNTFGAATSSVANITVAYSVGTFLGQSTAVTNQPPAVAGSGVVVEVFNGVGGGAAPTPGLLTNATPSGLLLSPVLDFPRPGNTVTVGNSFELFFTNTVVAPESIASLSASNFVLRQQFLLRVESGMDQVPETPDIDVQLGVGSDDGYYLAVGGVPLGSVGDRSFAHSWHSVSFESEGLYPVYLLFAANASGASGLEFAWQTATSGGVEIVPQEALYPDLNVGDQLITFEEVPVNTVLSNQYIAKGVLFESGGAVTVTTNFPSRFVPVSPVQVLAPPNANPPSPAEVQFHFVVPNATNPATTTFVSFYVIDAESTGAVVTAYGPSSEVLYTNTFHGGTATREQVVIQAPNIARVQVTLGQGGDTAAIDDLSLSTPAYVNTPPVLDPIADVDGDEGVQISFNATASDADEPSSGLVYSLLAGAPFGSTISPSGQFVWTPSEFQGPGVYPITVQVRDNAIPPGVDTNQFTVTVFEVNRSPVFPLSPLLYTHAGATLQFDLNTSDPDLPAQTLTHEFDGVVPAGMSLAAGTSNVTWNVPLSQPEGTTNIRFRVTDDGIPNLSATRTVAIVVDNSGPRVTSSTPSGAITWRPSSIDVFFDSEIVASSVSLADAALSGPGAPAITSVQRIGPQQYRIHLASPLPTGTFELSVGPDILDDAGNAMNQDGDGLNGEPSDAFVSMLTVELADLLVASVSAPAAGTMGGSVPVVIILTNQGTATASGPWLERFQLATDTNGSGVVYLGNVTFTGQLDAATSLTSTQDVILPNGQFGPRYLGVTADSGDAVVESNEANNTRYSPTVTTIAAPDLVAAGIAPPVAAELGATIDVVFTTDNAGDASSGPFSDRLWLSGTSNSVSGATVLATVPQLPLASAASVIRTQSVVLPFAGYQPGGYFLVLQADALGDQSESSEFNNLTSAPLALVYPPRPDLTVPTVSAPSNAVSGQAASISWVVTNQGALDLDGSWSETLFIATNATGAGAVEIMTYRFTNTLATGSSLSRTQTVVVPPTSPLGSVWFTVWADSREDVSEESETNNLRVATAGTQIPAVLTLQPSASQISEGASQPLFVNVTRNGSRAAALTVAITNGDPSEITVTNQVTIPAGAATASFHVDPLWDGIVDGAQIVPIEVSAPGFQSATGLVTVLDVDVPTLSVQLATNMVQEGQLLAGTVFRDAGTNQSVTVTVLTSSPDQLLPPAPVTIPAGANSADFWLVALDDSLVEYPTTYAVSVSAPGHAPGQTDTTVLDNDVPMISMALLPDTVGESAGPQASLLTLTRASVSPRIMQIDLESTDTNLVQVPRRVTIPAGETNVSVPVAILDNAVVEGPRIVDVRAWVLASSGASRLAELTPATLTVNDDDGPTLKVSLNHPLVAEGLDPAATGTVSRNTDPTNSLLVSLAVSDTNEVSVPPTVLIPAGAASASFEIVSMDDGVPDGSKGVTILASASGFVSGTAQLVVSDVNLPDLVVSGISAPLVAETEAFVNLGYTLRNQGPSAMPSNSVSQRILLSTDPLPGDDILLGEYTFNGPLPPGVDIGQTFQVRLPQQSGDYWVLVEADVLEVVPEVLEDNNRAVSTVQLRVDAAYDAEVSTTVESGPMGTPIPLTGHAFKPGGAPMPFSLVNIHIDLRGTRRVIAALTDANGDFSTTWQPLPGEAGLYEISASHPGVGDTLPQDSFMLFGMNAEPPFVQLVLPETVTRTGVVEIVNAGDLTLTDLNLQLTNQPANLVVDVALATNIVAGLATNHLLYSITALDASIPGAEFAARITSSQGATLDISFYTAVEELKARLEAQPTRLLSGMKRGIQRLVSFDLVNYGGAASGPIQVPLPAIPWMSLVSPNPLPSLEPGATNRVTLRLLPPDDIELTTFTGSLALNAPDNGLALPFEFRALSEAKGDLLITAVDEFTYYAEGSPNLTNAAVEVRDALTGTTITNGVTGTNGQLFVPQLMEGYYDLVVTADRHGDFSGTILVGAGVTNEVSAFLTRETVQYTWSVERIEIEDRYQITIETEFEANVPAPVVTVDPPMIDLSDLGTVGQFKQVNMTLENHGLIAADGTYIRFASHPFYEIKPLIENVGRLPAKSSLTIPVMVRRIGDFASNGSESKSVARVGFDSASPAGFGAVVAAGGTPVPCSIGGEVGFYYECGNHEIRKTINLPVVGVDWICSVGEVVRQGLVGIARFIYSLIPEYGLGEGRGTDRNPGIPTGGGGGGNIILPRIQPISLGINLGCAQGECLVLAAGGCISKIPGVGCFFSGFACGVGLVDTGGTDPVAWVDCGVGAAGCLIPPLGAAACIYSLARCAYGIVVAQGGEVVAAAGDPVDGFKPGLRAMLDSFNELTGAPDGVWLNASTDESTGLWYERFQSAVSPLSDGGRPVTAAERADLMTGDQPAGVDASEITRFLDRWNRSLENYALGILRPADAPPGANTDFIDAIALRDHLDTAGDYQQLAENAGFTDPINAIVETVRFRANEGGAGGTCARVKLRIDQRAVLSREAFRATLELSNEEGAALENIAVDLLITDGEGNDALALFGIRDPELINLDDVSGGGSVPTGASGTARWTIVPTVDAAPALPVEYFVSGEMRYEIDGVPVAIPLLPVPITVNPTARLALHYFHERDVFSDDPHTEEIEPSIPFNLAVMVNNFGAGDARQFRITSAQPQIIENEKGLLIDFKIIGTEVAGQNLTPTLEADFGTIPAGEIAIGRWLLTSTLQGLFIDYSATFEHLDGQGNPRLSLIDSVDIHEMNRLVRAEPPFNDGKPDFLVNDIPDLREYPDTLWLSDGSTQHVEVVTNAVVTGILSPGNLQVQLSAAMPGGWAYLRVPDPSGGAYRLTEVRRADNSLVTNAWTTDRTFHGQGTRPVEEYVLHLLDHNAAGDYTLIYALLPEVDTLPPESSVAALPQDSRTLMQLDWAGQDNTGGSGIAYYDVYVSDDGGPFQRWLAGTTAESALFQGVFGKHYSFYSIAVDGAGNREPVPAAPDAQTVVSLTNRPPVITPVPVTTLSEGESLVLNLSVTDPDGDGLSFSLLPGAPAGIVLNPVSGRLSWVTGEAHGPSTNSVTVRVNDTGTPQQSDTETLTIIVLDVNSAPTLAPVPDAYIVEGQTLSLTNSASDTDQPSQQLTFSLGPGVPAGAMINPVTGLFVWTPSSTQGGTTNRVDIIVSDNGLPSLSTTQTVAIVVGDTQPDFDVNLGTIHLLSGAGAEVPLTLRSGSDLTNVQFVLLVDQDRLTNLALTALAPEVASANFLPLGSNRFDLRFQGRSDAFLQGEFTLAQLAFDTVPDDHSTIVSMRGETLTGRRASSSEPLSGRLTPGRVFVVGAEPLLHAPIRTNGMLGLILYAQPGDFYVIENNTNLLNTGTWKFDRLVDATAVRTDLPDRAMTQTAEYFRASTLPLNQLTIWRVDDQVVIEWPLECVGCALEESPRMGPGATWVANPTQPQEVNGRLRVSLPLPATPTFYRLLVLPP